MDSLIRGGEELFNCGDIGKAEEFFSGIIQNHPACKEAHNNLGVIAYNRNRLEEAAGFFKQALKIDPGYREALDNLAEIRSPKSNFSYPENNKLGSDDLISGKKIALVNPFDNKFNQIYEDYFNGRNEVRLVKADSREEILSLEAIMNWADIIYCPWANEPLIYLSSKRSDFLLVTNIRSYEIFFNESMRSVNWDNVDGLIFVADHVRQIANQKWSESLSSLPQTTIHNCVELDKYPFYEKSPGKKIGYVGYLNAKKGIELLMQCVSAAVALDPEYCFYLAGEFQEERFEIYVRHLIKELDLEENIIFHGWVLDIPAFLNDMNYIISTSPWEGCPNNIIEAMACGVKPLIHNWQGASDIFPKEFVFNTVGEFVSLLKSPNYNSSQYRQYVHENFDAQKQLLKIDKFIYSCLESTPHVCSRPGPNKSINSVGCDDIAAKCQAESDKAVEPADAINFLQPLPAKIGIVDNRKAYTVDFCRGKRVLHIGCVDAGMMKKRIAENNYLHYQINEVAAKLVGIDIDAAGIELLKTAGHNVERMNIENDQGGLARLTKDIDAIVVPEVIEHLSNIGNFLDNLYSSNFNGDILISTPNSFSYRVARFLSRGVELVHPDHNCYYSLVTLTTLLNKHGFIIKRQLMYYWPGNDEFGRAYEKVLEKNPYLAEGLIVIVNRKTIS